MNATRIGVANPISHIMSRQIGDNIVSFRQNLFRERLTNAQNLYRMNMIAHYGCVNAIEFSKNGELLTSGKFISFSFAQLESQIRQRNCVNRYIIRRR